MNFVCNFLSDLDGHENREEIAFDRAGAKSFEELDDGCLDMLAASGHVSQRARGKLDLHGEVEAVCQYSNATGDPMMLTIETCLKI